MAPSTYDVNVQLMLATSAEHEGDLDGALEFLAAAHRLARTSARVHVSSAAFRARNRGGLSMMKQLSLSLLAAVL
jgi:hypothetical protein